MKHTEAHIYSTVL